jgi:hypothetical protein
VADFSCYTNTKHRTINQYEGSYQARQSHTEVVLTVCLGAVIFVCTCRPADLDPVASEFSDVSISLMSAAGAAAPLLPSPRSAPLLTAVGAGAAEEVPASLPGDLLCLFEEECFEDAADESLGLSEGPSAAAPDSALLTPPVALEATASVSGRDT